MCCLQLDNPESKKVAEVAKAAGEAWRAMPQEQKDGYEDLSTEAKVNSLLIPLESGRAGCNA